MKKVISIVLTLVMLVSGIPTMAFAETANSQPVEKQGTAEITRLQNGVKFGTVEITMLEETKDQPSMCDIMFDKKADVQVDGNKAMLMLYVAYPVPAFESMGKEGTVQRVKITYNGTQYHYMSDITTKPLMTSKTTNSEFGFVEGAQIPAQTLTFMLPEAALHEEMLKVDAYVNVVMNKDVVLRMKLSNFAYDEDAKKAVDDAITKINAVETVTLEDAAKVKDARKAYNALSVVQKIEIRNVGVLTAAEATIARLQDEKDTADAKAFDKLVSDIGNVSLESKAAIEKAEKALKGLSEAAIEKAEKVNVLTEARAAYDKLVEADAKAETDAKAFDKLVSDIGNVSLESKAAIEKAEKALTGLSEAAKAKAEKVNVLAEARSAYDKLVAEADAKAAEAAQIVDEKIAAIGKVTINSEALIKEARAAYDALSNEAKAKVETLERLTRAEAELSELKEAAKPSVKPEADKDTDKPIVKPEAGNNNTAVESDKDAAKAPKTGDETNALPWIMAMLIATLSASAVRRKMNR